MEARGFLRSGDGAGEVTPKLGSRRAGTVHDLKTAIIGVRICSEVPSSSVLPEWWCTRLAGQAVQRETFFRQ